MLLAWRSESLREVCSSSTRLARACAERVEVAQDLLGAVVHAPTVASLARSRCIRVRPRVCTELALTALEIGIEEVHVVATPLTPQGRPITYGDSIWPDAARVTALRVEDLEIAGASVLKVAS